MFFLSHKRFRSSFILLLSMVVSASVAICPCPPDFTADHHHAQAKNEGHCHEAESNHEHNDTKHETSGHACLCDGGPINGYLAQGEKAPVKTDFLVAVLAQFQSGFAVVQPSFKPLGSTHSPPLISQPLYITHLTLLI